MPAPNVVIVYVNDAPAAAAFYGRLFDLSPSFETPRYISFPIAPGMDLALWSGASSEFVVDPAIPRTSELCLSLDGGPERIEEQYRAWQRLGVTVLEEPHDEVFGRTFVVADPDGNRIRVAPVD